MESRWAVEHLEVIRTLMERAAVYRRALAPTTLLAGGIGTVAALAGWVAGFQSPRTFSLYWMFVGVVGIAAALLVMRRQALKDLEPFWSLPARRVAQAMLPPLVIGLVAGWAMILLPSPSLGVAWLPAVWMVLYGCALHAAGFFMPRGIRLFGWGFVLIGSALLLGLSQGGEAAGAASIRRAHVWMGAAFGGLHLAYGLYLRLTEPRKHAA
jgi:hypothetical protein